MENKNKPEDSSVSDKSLYIIKQELEQLKGSLYSLANRLKNLEIKIDTLGESKKTVIETPQQETNEKHEPVKVEKEAAIPKKGNIEVNMGRFWLNKAGIIIFTLGIGFLISYSFKYFPAIAKIVFGYLVSAGLFFFGLKLEKKERFVAYGRVLLGGAWAIAYFTTYAMYHFDASRIINSRLLDLLFLSVVASGIIIHSLRYKSQELAALALFVGYITSTLGDIGYFTFLSCGVLVIVLLVLVHKLQWIKVIFLGIALTYFTHLFWVIKQIYASRVEAGYLNVRDVYFLINGSFLFLYWAMFTIGIHLIKKSENDQVYNKLSAANFCNALLFFFMVYPKLSWMYPEHKFTFISGLGAVYLIIAVIMEKIKNNKLFTSNIVISFSLLTLSVPLKYLSYQTSLIWLVELPFVLFMGLSFERKVFRYFSFSLALVIFFKILFVDLDMGIVNILGCRIDWNKLITFLGFISMAVCFYLGRYSKNRLALTYPERNIYHLFSGLAAVYLTMFIWGIINLNWLTFSLSIEALIIFLCGVLLLDKCLRVYSLLLFLIVAFRFCFLDDSYYSLSQPLKWFIISVELISLNAIYFLYRQLRDKSLLKAGEKGFIKPLFIISLVLLAAAIFKHIQHSWISLALGIAGVMLFITGFLSKDKLFRFGGFVIFALTVFRVIFVDLSMLPITYKIISFIILGMLFLGVSFIYTKYNIGKLKE